MIFRVHTVGGYIEIDAESPNEARAIAKERHPGIIVTKVKRVKETSDG